MQFFGLTRTLMKTHEPLEAQREIIEDLSRKKTKKIIAFLPKVIKFQRIWE
jgi:hypothetical protein